MISFLYTIAILCNIFCFSVKKESRIVKLLTLIIILIIWGGNVFGPDIANYMRNYKIGIHSIAQEQEKLYYIFMNICFSLKFTFFQYRIIVSLCAILVFYFVFKKFNTNIHLISVLYMLTIFFMDGIQIRNFLGLAFVYLGLYILYEKNKWWKIEYIICIILASLIHSALIVYLVFLIVPKDLDKKYSKREIRIILGGGILFYLYMYAFRNSLNFLVSITEIGGEAKATEYAQYTTHYGSLIIFLLQMIAIILSMYNYKKVVEKNKIIVQKNYDTKLCGIEKDLKVLKFIIYINTIALLFVPFSIIQSTYYRLIRNLVLLNFIGMGIVSKWYKRNVKIFIINFIFIGIWFYKEYVFGGGFQEYIIPFMEYNKFLK